MSWIDALVLGLIAAAVIAAVIYMIHGRKQGKSGCGSCPYRENCRENCREKFRE